MKKIIFSVLFLVFLDLSVAQPKAKSPALSKTNNVKASSDQTKAKGPYDDLFPSNNYFMKAVDVFSIDIKSVPACKKTFTELCGEAKFPLSSTFTTCLQTKYNQFKENASCENLGTALVANNYLVWLTRTTETCSKYYDKCYLNLKPRTQKSFSTCMATDASIPPLCIKLVQDAAANTYVLTEIYENLKGIW